MDTLKRRLLTPAALILSACAQSPAPEQAISQDVQISQEVQEPVVVSDHEMCDRAVRVIVNPLVARPGATLKIFSDYPLSYAPPLDVPDELLTHWRASPAGVATFSADGTQAFVSETAVPGQDITLTALFCGKETITKTVPVAAKDQPVIVGYWKQESVSCPADAPQHHPVRELVFDPDGGFSITYVPFETRRDFSGTHRFDHRTGALEATLTEGDLPLGDVTLSGSAKLETEKRLMLEDIYLGPTAHPGAGCKYVFVK